MRKEPRSYILSVAIRGTETHLIEARSAKEAREIFEAGGTESCTDLDVHWKGVPRVWVDGGRAMHKKVRRSSECKETK